MDNRAAPNLTKGCGLRLRKCWPFRESLVQFILHNGSLLPLGIAANDSGPTPQPRQFSFLLVYSALAFCARPTPIYPAQISARLHLLEHQGNSSLIIFGIIGGIKRLAGPSPVLTLFPAALMRSAILPPKSRNTTTPMTKRCQMLRPNMKPLFPDAPRYVVTLTAQNPAKPSDTSHPARP